MNTSKENRQETVQPYLFFGGRCEEAIEFYCKTLGAEPIQLMRFKDAPDPNACAAGAPDKVMHSAFRVGGSALMASDGCGDEQPKFEGFSLSFTAPNDAEAERVFRLLANGGQVQMPIGKTFFASQFGIVTDRFGVSWMVIVPLDGPKS
jgi:PhnB protein